MQEWVLMIPLLKEKVTLSSQKMVHLFPLILFKIVDTPFHLFYTSTCEIPTLFSSSSLKNAYVHPSLGLTMYKGQ